MHYVTHGSHDSVDVDRVYFFAQLPLFRECQRFCAETDENRNIAVVRGGVVVDCFKGLPDEVNNAVLRTFGMHEQLHPCPVTRAVVRNVPLKLARGIRVLLTRLTRTSSRLVVKEALRSADFNQTRAALARIDFRSLELSADALKSVAFQLGQMLALVRGQEFYTKQELAGRFTDLDPFLYRAPERMRHVGLLNHRRDELLGLLSGVEVQVRGELNLFTMATPDEAGVLWAQCRGAVCDLKAERAVVLPPGEVGRPLVSLTHRDGRSELYGDGGFDAPQAEAARALMTPSWLSRFDPERQHFFHLLDGGRALVRVAERHRATGDVTLIGGASFPTSPTGALAAAPPV